MRHNSRPLWQLAAYMAAIVLLGTIISIAKPQPVLSDSDLTQAVNASFIPRTEDPELHDLAHQRALEASVNFSHDGSTTAEVLAFNSGFADPIATVISQWLGSPAHAAILMDPTYTTIGCGSVTTSDGRYFAACLLAPGPSLPTNPTPTSSPLVVPAATPPVVVIPNTALESP